jgi:enamine deaminase RidA (YjgF/YER057c/UK114 family)
MSRFSFFNPDALPAPKGFNHGVMAPGAGRILFVAGQIGCDRQGAVVSSDIVEQFELALGNMMLVIREAGGTPESIARLTIYTTDVLQYRSRLKGLGEAYRKVMGRHYPAMALLEVKGLFEPNARIELEATAIL